MSDPPPKTVTVPDSIKHYEIEVHGDVTQVRWFGDSPEGVQLTMPTEKARRFFRDGVKGTAEPSVYVWQIIRNRLRPL